MKIYYASVFGNNSGELVDVIYTFTIIEFNASYIDCQNRFNCHPACKTIIDFDDKLSEQQIADKLSKYGITITKSQMPTNELSKAIEEVVNKYHFETCKEEEFEHISSNEFLSKLKPSPGFSIACVEVGVKSSISV